jgi:hypothetical protein
MVKINVLLTCGIFFLSSVSVAQTDSLGVREGVRQMADAIACDLHNEGPVAWLKYFSHSDDFLMASDGQLAFSSFDSASVFVHNFAKNVHRVDLTWSKVRIDSLSPVLALLAASYHETMFKENGPRETPAGYFTAVVEYLPIGWKLRNVHWSSIRHDH